MVGVRLRRCGQRKRLCINYNCMQLVMHSCRILLTARAGGQPTHDRRVSSYAGGPEVAALFTTDKVTDNHRQVTPNATIRRFR